MDKEKISPVFKQGLQRFDLCILHFALYFDKPPWGSVKRDLLDAAKTAGDFSNNCDSFCGVSQALAHFFDYLRNYKLYLCSAQAVSIFDFTT
ncbi:MAG: hypothetical protein RSG55_05235 [Oscillospiraceae bacterium]